jgi:hypothetical protein
MTITYSSTSSQVQAGLTTIVCRQPASLAAGDLILWLCANKYPTAAPATPTGGFAPLIQKLGGSGAAGADAGEIYGTAFSMVSDGTEDGATQTVNITGGNTAIARAVSFARSAGTGWLVAATAGSQASGSNSWSVVGDAALDLVAGDVVLIYVAKNGDNDTNLTAHAITASGITFGAWNSITAHEGTTGGQDCAQAIGYFNVTAGNATVVPTFTVSLAGSANLEAGAVLFIRLREDGTGPTPIAFTGTIPTLTGAQGSAFSEDLSANWSGSETPFSFALSGTPPAGVSFNTSTCEFTGTPTVGSLHGPYVITGTDDASNTADSNPFYISLSSNPTADVGYYAIAHTDEDKLQHTTASHSFFHDGKWWTFLPVSSNWNLYEESGNTPASPGDTVDWSGSAHLSSVVTSQAFLSVCLDAANNLAYVVGYGSGATVVFHALLYSGGSWAIDQSTNLTGTGGVGLGTASTFASNAMLSVGVDSNGVPLVVAGNKGAGGSATNGVHIAWPNGGEASINGVWTSAVIDSALTTTIDESGRFAGIISQGGTDYVVVCYTDHTNERTRLAYHEVETTLSDYATGWTLVTIDSTVSVDNHVWAGVMNFGGDQVVVTIIKGGDGAKAGRIYVMTSELGASLTWTHKIHRVTGGPGEAGALEEAPSRPCGVLDETNGEVWVFYHTADSHPYEWIGYKKALLSDLLAASAEGDVFDFAVAENGIPAINDETYNAAWNVKTPAHPIDSSMGYFPITGTVLSNSTTGDSVWWQKYAIAGAATFNPAWARGANTIIGARA